MKRAFLLFALIEVLILAGLAVFVALNAARWLLWALGVAIVAEACLGIGLLLALRKGKGN